MGLLQANEENLLPVFQQDQETNGGHHGDWRNAILVSGGFSLLFNAATNLENRFGPLNQDGSGSSNPEIVMKCKECFVLLLPEIIQVSKVLTFFVITMILIKALRSRLKWVIMLLALLAPLSYFPGLAREAPEFSVICGTFKMSIFWFVAFGGAGFPLLLFIVMMFFCSGLPGA